MKNVIDKYEICIYYPQFVDKKLSNFNYIK
jgi:hypothetical protein